MVRQVERGQQLDGSTGRCGQSTMTTTCSDALAPVAAGSDTTNRHQYARPKHGSLPIGRQGSRRRIGRDIAPHGQGAVSSETNLDRLRTGGQIAAEGASVGVQEAEVGGMLMPDSCGFTAHNVRLDDGSCTMSSQGWDAILEVSTGSTKR
jgi:hypothetical protein